MQLGNHDAVNAFSQGILACLTKGIATNQGPIAFLSLEKCAQVKKWFMT